jgi:hypothetical protein
MAREGTFCHSGEIAGGVYNSGILAEGSKGNAAEAHAFEFERNPLLLDKGVTAASMKGTGLPRHAAARCVRTSNGGCRGRAGPRARPIRRRLLQGA